MTTRKKLVLLLVLVLVVTAPLTGGCRFLFPQEEEPRDETPNIPDEATDPTDQMYEDGTYTGESVPDDRGWRGVVEIVVEGGQITEVNYEELDEEENPKSEDEDYNERWEEQAGISAGEAFPGYEEALLEAQDIDEVDVITGATSTYGKFTAAVEDAFGGGENGAAD